MRARPSRNVRRARRVLLLLSLLASTLGAATSASAIDYVVEVVLFEHRGLPVIGDDRYWVPVPRRSIGLGTPEAAAAGFVPVEGPLSLSDEVERMRTSGYRVLRHFAWRQPGLDEANAVPIRLNLGERLALWTPPDGGDGGDFLPAGPSERDDRPLAVTTTTLAGTLRVRLGRFLHLEARLAYDDPATGTGYRLDESRKMRSRELHYLDNPRFGLLTRIVPVEADEAIDATPAAVEEDEEARQPLQSSDGLSEDGLPDTDGPGAPVQ